MSSIENKFKEKVSEIDTTMGYKIFGAKPGVADTADIRPDMKGIFDSIDSISGKDGKDNYVENAAMHVIKIEDVLIEYAADKENNDLASMLRDKDISVTDLVDYLEIKNRRGEKSNQEPYDVHFGCNPNDGSPVESRMDEMTKYLEETVIPNIESEHEDAIKDRQMDNMTKNMKDIYDDYLDMIKEGEDLDSSDLMAMFEEEGYGVRELVDYMNYQNEKNDSNNNYTPYDPYFGTNPKDGSPIESRVNAMAKYLEETFMPQVNENTYADEYIRDRVVYSSVPEEPISEIPIIARPIIITPNDPGLNGPDFAIPNDPGFTVPNDPGLNGPDFATPNDPGFTVPNDPGFTVPNDPGLNGPDFKTPEKPLFDGPVRSIRDIGKDISGTIKEGIASLRSAISEKEDFEKVEQNVVSNSTYSQDIFTSKDDVSAEKESDLTLDFDVSL